jgi:asparagine synthetase B (glutamine-hydrolysing)
LYDKDVCYAVRDPYGVRPLYQGVQNNMICFASEIKMFPPGFDIKEVFLVLLFVVKMDE